MSDKATSELGRADQNRGYTHVLGGNIIGPYSPLGAAPRTVVLRVPRNLDLGSRCRSEVRHPGQRCQVPRSTRRAPSTSG